MGALLLPQFAMHPTRLASSGEIKLPAKLIVVSDVAFDIQGQLFVRREREDEQSVGQKANQ